MSRKAAAAVGTGAGFWNVILGAEILTGIGVGAAMVPSSRLALDRIDLSDAGAASAAVNAVRQVGSSLGLAVLTTVAVSTTAHSAASRAAGYVQTFWWDAALMALALLAGSLGPILSRPRRVCGEASADPRS